jgi:hypothetical protein
LTFRRFPSGSIIVGRNSFNSAGGRSSRYDDL